MTLSNEDRDLIARRVAQFGMTLKDAQLFNTGHTLFIEVAGAGPSMLRSASSEYVSPHRATTVNSDSIPWLELTPAERVALISEIIVKLRATVRA